MNLERYQIISEYHRGINSSIYEAVDLFTNARVALKRLHEGSSEEVKETFRNDYLTMAVCRHPVLVSVEDFGVWPGSDSCYYVMPWIDHESLENYNWNFEHLICLSIQTAQSLVYLHRHDLMFERISLSHILWLKSPEENDIQIKLINYGTRLRKNEPQFQSNLSDPGNLRNDLIRMSQLILKIVSMFQKKLKGSHSDYAHVSQLMTILKKWSEPTSTATPWKCVMMLIKHFDNHPTTPRPARRIFFAEPPDVGFESLLYRLDTWQDTSSSGSVLLLGSLVSMGRHRLLRRWLPSVRLSGTQVIELDENTVIPLMKTLTSEKSELPGCCQWLAPTKNLLIIVHRSATAHFLSYSLSEILTGLKRFGWKMLISLDETGVVELEKRMSESSVSLQQIWLPLLGRDSVQKIMTLLLETDTIPRKLPAELVRVAGGNPGLLVKTINYWIGEDLLIQESNRWRLVREENQPMPVPPVVKETIISRLNILDSTQMEFLRKVALMEMPVSKDSLIPFFENLNLDILLKQLVRLDIFMVDTSEPGCIQYRFSHDFFIPVILKGMSSEEIRNTHLMLASVMVSVNGSSTEIAQHYLYGGDTIAGVKTGLEVAGDLRVEGNFLKAEEWVDLLRTKLDGLPLELQGQVYYLHAEISLLRHRNYDVLESSKRGLELLPENSRYIEERGFLHQYIGQVYTREGKYKEALEAVRSGLDELSDQVNETSVTLRILAGAIYRYLGDYTSAEKQVELSWKIHPHLMDPISSTAARTTILNLQSTLLIDRGKIEKARLVLEKAIALSDKHSFTYYRIILRNKQALLETSLGRLGKAESCLAEVLRLCQIAKIQSEVVVAFQISGKIALLKGHYEDSETYFQKAGKISEQLKRTRDTQDLKCYIAQLCRVTGRFSECREIITEQLEKLEQTNLTANGLSLIIEAGFLEHAQSKYSAALRYFYLARKWIRSVGGHRFEALVLYGLALTYWRLNHLPRTYRYQKRAYSLAMKTGNLELQSWLLLLRARMERLDRNMKGFESSISNAENWFISEEIPQGKLAVDELRLRTQIDMDLSDEIWKKAIDLWERARKFGAWQQLMDIGITVARLGVRRGSTGNVAVLLDALIDSAREKGCIEEQWRLSRVRAQFQEERGFKTGTRESLESAIINIKEVSRNIRSPLLKRSYLNRYDVKQIKSKYKQLQFPDVTGYQPLNRLPSLIAKDKVIRGGSSRYSSEYDRLLRQAVGRFRQYLDPNELVEDLMDVSLKVSGADRGVVFLRQPRDDVFRIMGVRQMGRAPELDHRIIRMSSLFQKVISEGQMVFSRNLAGDRYIKARQLKRIIGNRAVLLIPLRAVRDTVGLMYIDTRSNNADKMGLNAGLIQDLADESAMSLEISALYLDLDDTFMNMVRALGSTVDAKDEYTHGHSARVATYSLQIGQEIGLKSEEMRDLEIGAYFHDIGKIGISGSILKSSGRLSEEDREAIRMHPVIGTRILSPIRKLSHVAQAIRQHHERYDGTGYPDQLKGEQILLNARIIAIADAIDAMTTKRPYHDAMTLKDAVDVVTANAGTQFDPTLAGVVRDLYIRNKFRLA